MWKDCYGWALVCCCSTFPPSPSLHYSTYRILAIIAGATAPGLHLPPSPSLHYTTYRILAIIAGATAPGLHLPSSPSLQYSTYSIEAKVVGAKSPRLHLTPFSSTPCDTLTPPTPPWMLDGEWDVNVHTSLLCNFYLLYIITKYEIAYCTNPISYIGR